MKNTYWDGKKTDALELLEDKNVDILNVLAKKPSKKSVKNNIIVQNAKVLEP